MLKYHFDRALFISTLSCFLSSPVFANEISNSESCNTIFSSREVVQNLHPSTSQISRQARQQWTGQKGMVIWMSGLSGSGKTTLARALEFKLVSTGINAYVLDGDNIRQGLNKGLSFDEAGRIENNRRVAEVAKLMADAGVVVITAFISPLNLNRKTARDIIGDNFHEVYVKCPLAVCASRDVKGLYALAMQGKIKDFTGISSPFEEPQTSDVIVETEKTDIDSAVDLIIQKFNLRNRN